MVLTTVAFMAYFLGSHNERNETVWECYRSIWGDLGTMRRLDIDNFTAEQVYNYCADLSNSERAAHSNSSIEADSLKGFRSMYPIYLEQEVPKVDLKDVCPRCTCEYDEDEPPEWLNREITE